MCAHHPAIHNPVVLHPPYPRSGQQDSRSATSSKNVEHIVREPTPHIEHQIFGDCIGHHVDSLDECGLEYLLTLTFLLLRLTLQIYGYLRLVRDPEAEPIAVPVLADIETQARHEIEETFDGDEEDGNGSDTSGGKPGNTGGARG